MCPFHKGSPILQIGNRKTVSLNPASKQGHVAIVVPFCEL